MTVRICSFFVSALIAISVCAPSHARSRDEVTVTATYYNQTGNPMANGQRYDPNNPGTAAGPQWLFGKKVRLTELETGQWIIVDVTDKMPKAGGRNKMRIDLPPAAFKKFAKLERGTLPLKLEVLR
jgi:rare lipoprotein A (peptidoglycan hydrolase)